MTALIVQLTQLRNRFPQLRARHWVEGRRSDGSYGVLWFTPQATEMTEQDWSFPGGRFLAYALGPVEQGQSPLYIVFNAAPEPIEFTLPMLPEIVRWIALLNTAHEASQDEEIAAGSKSLAPARSVLVFAGVA
jgi:glycogen operon protein